MAKYRVKQIGNKYYPQIRVCYLWWRDLLVMDDPDKIIISTFDGSYEQDNMVNALRVVTLYKNQNSPIIIHKID